MASLARPEVETAAPMLRRRSGVGLAQSARERLGAVCAKLVECAGGCAANLLRLVVEGGADLLESLVCVEARKLRDGGGAHGSLAARKALLNRGGNNRVFVEGHDALLVQARQRRGHGLRGRSLGHGLDRRLRRVVALELDRRNLRDIFDGGLNSARLERVRRFERLGRA